MVYQRGRELIEEMNVVDRQHDRAALSTASQVAPYDRQQVDPVDRGEIAGQQVGHGAEGERPGGLRRRDHLDVAVRCRFDCFAHEPGLSHAGPPGDHHPAQAPIGHHRGDIGLLLQAPDHRPSVHGGQRGAIKGKISGHH